MGMSQEMEVLTSHDSQDWLTPPFYIELVREVLGEIDLDPASHPVSQEWIKAKECWTSKGLESLWDIGDRTRVFCNPPYGKTGSKSNQGLWSMFMHIEYSYKRIEEGILLINSTHGYSWYEDIWRLYPCCLLRERIKFLYPWNGEALESGQAKKGQTLVYFGDNIRKFNNVFKSHGRIILP